MDKGRVIEQHTGGNKSQPEHALVPRIRSAQILQWHHLQGSTDRQANPTTEEFIMKTRQSIVAIALTSVALISGAVAGGFPTNPERDVIDQTVGTSFTAAESNDGWKDVGGERGVMYVGGGTVAAGGDAHAYTKDELLQARLDYREGN